MMVPLDNASEPHRIELPRVDSPPHEALDNICFLLPGPVYAAEAVVAYVAGIFSAPVIVCLILAQILAAPLLPRLAHRRHCSRRVHSALVAFAWGSALSPCTAFFFLPAGMTIYYVTRIISHILQR